MTLEVRNHNVPDADFEPPGTSEDLKQLRDRTITREDVPEEWHEAVFESDDFIIEGPASVEIVDRTGQEIKMEALEAALERFMHSDEAPGIISLEHKDVPVGVPLWDWNTDGGEHYETTVRGDEFTLVSNIANDTEKAKEARLRALNEDLDGYSVTVFSKKEGTRDSDGARVTVECDLHSVTLGEDSKLMNPEADFDVVDHKWGSTLGTTVKSALLQGLRSEETGLDKAASNAALSLDLKMGPDTPRSFTQHWIESSSATFTGVDLKTLAIDPKNWRDSDIAVDYDDTRIEEGDTEALEESDEYIQGPEGQWWTRDQIQTPGVAEFETGDKSPQEIMTEHRNQFQEDDAETALWLAKQYEQGSYTRNQAKDKLQSVYGVADWEAKDFLDGITSRMEVSQKQDPILLDDYDYDRTSQGVWASGNGNKFLDLVATMKDRGKSVPSSLTSMGPRSREQLAVEFSNGTSGGEADIESVLEMNGVSQSGIDQFMDWLRSYAEVPIRT